MEFDPNAVPPRVPSPTGLILNPGTGRIDFSLADMTIPADCAAQQTLPEAACEFDQYLQSLNGFPSVTPATAPASVALDLATLTLGDNVVVLNGKGEPVPEVDVAFDGASRYLTVTPRSSWVLGETYWLAVRGYDRGVRTANGDEVVGSPTQFLLKQDDSLTCGASAPSLLDRNCPAFALLLSQDLTRDDAARALFKLEDARLSYRTAGAWDTVAAAGLAKSEVAALWGFPIHAASVAELSPPALVPSVTAPNEIRVAVHGPVDAATVSPFVLKQQLGSVVLMDLDLVATDLANGLPRVSATVADGSIVITGAAPFVAGHTIGLFFTSDIHDDKGNPLVPSPVSVLLTLRGSLVDNEGHSTVPGISNGDAATLEDGRKRLAPLFDNASLGGITGVKRQNLVYCFAFTFAGTP